MKTAGLLGKLNEKDHLDNVTVDVAIKIISGC
jgi:hypothetical protein